MSRRKGGREKEFNNVDYTQLTETDNGFVDSQVSINQCLFIVPKVDRLNNNKNPSV